MGWFIKFWEWLWLRGMKNWVSKLRWCRKSKVQSEPVYEINDTTMMGVVRQLYYGFDWHMDGIDDLFDTYMPAQYAYNLMYNYVEDKSEEKNPGDCFTGDVKIKCLDGKSYTFKELVDNGVKELWVYGCEENGEIVPVKAFNPHKKATTVPIVKVTLDNGKTFRCTEDHKIMMRDGSYKRVKDVVVGKDSIMPGYFYTDGKYLQVVDNATGERVPVHIMVNSKVNQRQKKEAEERSLLFSGQDAVLVTHHDDFCKTNNTPENLCWLTWGEHRMLHSKDGRAITAYNKSDAHRKVAAQNGPSNGRGRLIKYNTSQEHKDLVKEMNRDEEQTKLRMRGHILKTIKKIIENGEDFTKENYQKHRVGPVTPGWDRMLKYFSSREEAYESAKVYNHKIISIEYTGEKEEVYDITVPETHNFLLDAGIFVHNCDDFHAGILHLLQENGYDTVLITLATIPITQSHTMTAFRKKLGDDTYDYYVINYTRCLGPYDNLQDFVDNYGTPVRYWSLQGYNLEKGKYYNIDKEWGGVTK